MSDDHHGDPRGYMLGDMLSFLADFLLEKVG